MRNLIRIFLFYGIMFLAFSHAVYADVYLEIIVDGSGSMWGKIGDTYKIVMVRDAVIEFLGTTPEGVHIGIRDFGSKAQGKGDCKNTRLIQPIMKNNTVELINSVSTINPVGKSPIAYAVSQAFLDFEDTSQKRLIILIADGGDDCNRRACQWLINEIKGSKNIAVHVVGLDVAKNWESKQLECFASNYGGTYTDVNSGNTIVTAIHEILRKTTEEETVRLRQIDEEKRKQKEVEQNTRVSIEVTNDLPPLIADSIIVDTLIINGKPVDLGNQKELASKESRLFFDQTMPAGKHSLTISYKKSKEAITYKAVQKPLTSL